MKPEHDDALVEQAKAEWNAEADAYNQWEALDFNERIAVILPLVRAADAARIASLEAALRIAKEAIDEYQRYWFGGEMRGLYDGKPERAQLWAAGHAARATLRSSPDA